MNTTYASQNSILELTHTSPAPSDEPALLPASRLNASPALAWSWSANHLTGEKAIITGGIAQARMLVCAIDGDSWPWTLIFNADESAWIQVLGTHDACILEFATGDVVTMVARAHDEDPSTRRLPETCRHWISRCRADELFTTQEAAVLGIGFLTGWPLPDGLTTRTVHLGHPESRN